MVEAVAKIVVCSTCYESFRKWLFLQAKRDSSMKTRQTKAYHLYERLDAKKDIVVLKEVTK
jgi:hypothetical protein